MQMTDDIKSVADILSSTPAPTSESSQTETPTASEQAPAFKADETGRLHDTTGKFASKMPRAETPVVVAATPVEPTGDKPIEPTPPVVQSQPPHGHVPLAALVDQRLEARQAKQEAAEYKRQLEELRKPKADPVDFYADPDGAFNQRTEAALNPLQQQIMELKTTLFEERLYRIAGGEKAAKIEAEIGKALESQDPDVQMLANMLNTQGVAAIPALVQWYDKRSFDPVTERERLKAELLAELQAEGQAPAATATPAAAPVMPTNLVSARNVGTRTGPAWSGPKPLASIFAGVKH